jgi:hypothetical protein
MYKVKLQSMKCIILIFSVGLLCGMRECAVRDGGTRGTEASKALFWAMFVECNWSKISVKDCDV